MRLALLPLLLLLALVSLMLGLTVGSVPVPLDAVWPALWHSDTLHSAVILELRLPRLLAAFAVGGLLAVAGALLQVLLRNPLADPYILGVSGGAAVAALLDMLAGLGGVWVSGGALLGALGSVLLVFGLAHGGGGWTPTRLLLTGVVVAALWGALISFLLAVAPEHHLRGMLFWLMGDLSHGGEWRAPLALLLLGLLLLLPFARELNLLARGEITAGSLGVHVGRLRLVVYFAASLLTAAAVTSAGSVGFIGLIVPHMLRLVAGSNHRLLLPASALLGGSLLMLADTLARSLIAPQQLPVGVLTALIGAPVFLYLLRREAVR
jgi:iron complex transport system permease protein